MRRLFQYSSLFLFLTGYLMTNPGLAGKGGKFVIEPDAASLVHSFTRAIEENHWDEALSLCEPTIQEEAKKSPSAEVFLKGVVPLPEILWKAGVCSYDVKRRYNYFVRLGPDETGETGSWCWLVRNTKDVGWRIHLPNLSIDEWRKGELAAIQNENEWRERMKTTKASISPFVKTILSATDSVFEIGKPIWLNLRVENQSEVPLFFDNSQATFNSSMTITKVNGESVPYSAPIYQTGSQNYELPPKETRVVFDKMDLGSMYPLRESGTYQVQFNGGGLDVWFDDPFVNPVKRPSHTFGKISNSLPSPEIEDHRHCPIAERIPSNTITITVKAP